MKVSPIVQITKAQASKYCLEKGPNGEPGVWTRNGGSYAFFTPLTELEAREKEPQKISIPQSCEEETPEQYYQRKINSSEWLG